MLADEDHIPIDSIVCHVARFNLSSDRAVILNLSRVSLTSKNPNIRFSPFNRHESLSSLNVL